MPGFTPVDYDPFSQSGAQAVLTPVDHDPFAPSAALQVAFDQKKGVGNDNGVATSFAQGFSNIVPFGDQITSGIAALGARPFSGDTSLGQLYDQAQADSKVTQKQHPVANLAGTGAGILATLPTLSARAITGTASTTGIRGAINAIPAAQAAVGSFVRGGALAADAGPVARASALALRSAKAGLVAAPAGALYGAGNADPENRLAGAEQGAGLAAGVGAALPVAGAALGSAIGLGANIGKGFGARGEEALDASGQALKDISSKAYAKMRDIGATFTDDASKKLIGNIDDDLADDGPLNKGLHGTTMSIIDDLKDAAAKPGFGLEQLDQYRRLLSRVPRAAPEDARKASIVIDSLDHAVNGLGEGDMSQGGTEAVNALTQGRAAYARFSKFDRIADVITNSGGDANKLKRDLEKFASNPKKTRGFNDDEMGALRTAAANTTGEGLLKMAGKFGVDLGSSRAAGNAGLPAIIGAIGLNGVSAGIGGLSTAGATVAGGTAARYAQKLVARGKAEDLLKVIEQGGKITMNDVQALPTEDKSRFLQKIMQMSPLDAANIFSNEKVKK